MTDLYLSTDAGLEKVSEPESGCWISLVSPDKGTVEELSKRFDIDPDALKAALDLDERSRIEVDDNYTMVLVNIPTLEDSTDKELFTTIPLSVIITGDMVITVCSEDTPILKSFSDGKIRDFRTFMKSRFIFQVLYRTASLYLHYLRIIDKRSDEVENKLHKSTQNRELIELLKLEKSLVYFTTALRSNETVIEKLLRTDALKKYPEDSDLLEDVIVENKQAIEMANIYSGILSGMMDAFASVISNNLNIVMKVLAIITIVMSVPTMIFSAYGMNLNSAGMPFADSPWGFLIIVAMSVGLSIIATIVLIRLRMFK